MDFNWFFKGHFKNNQGRDSFPNTDENEDVNDMQTNDGRRDLNDVPFLDPFGTLEDTSLDLFQRMDAVISQMFSGRFGTFGPENFIEPTTDESDPRDTMLKEPNCEGCHSSPNIVPFEEYTVMRPSAMIDSDIDDTVAKHGLLLDESSLKNEKAISLQKKVSSIRKVQVYDGILEEHHSFSDNYGNTTTTVRRSIGDQIHEVTTHSDGRGIKEKQENFTNLDENELPNFEGTWKSIKEGKQMPIRDTQTKAFNPSLTSPPGDPSYLHLFKKFFSV